MSLDHLARTATRELLEHAPPEPGWMLGELKRTRRQRRATRYAAAALAVLLGAGGWALLQRDDGPPDPVNPPQVTNGAIVAPPDMSAGAWSQFDAFGSDLRLPDDVASFASVMFTPDGSELVYPGPEHTIKSVDVVTGETRTLGICLDEVCDPALSPDGTRLAYGAEEHLKIQDVATGEAEPVLTPGVEHTATPVWSPDGASIAFTGPRGLYVIDLASGAVREVYRYSTRIVDLILPSWSPDGRRIAFIDQRPRPSSGPVPNRSLVAMVVDADGTAARGLRAVGHCFCAGRPAPSLAWSPDGELIAVARSVGGGRPGIFTVRPDGTDWAMRYPGIYGAVAWQPVVD